MKNKFVKIMLIFSLLVSIYSCATVPYADEKDDVEAKSFKILPDKGNLYIVRDNNIVGSAIAFHINLDGKVIGSIAPNSYYLIQLDEGNHGIIAYSNENSVIQKFILKEGENYFYKVSVVMGVMSARVTLEKIDIELGKKLVISAKRIINMD